MKAKKVTMGNSTFSAALIFHFKACPDEKNKILSSQASRKGV